MRLIKCFALDVLASMRSVLAWLGVVAFCCALMLVALRIEVASEISSPDDGMRFDIAFGIGDYLIGYLAGCVPFVGARGEHFSIPIVWFVFFLLLAAGTIRYPKDSLRGFGQQVLVACRGWWTWWISKCFWVMFCVVLFAATALIVALTFSIVAGSGLDWSVSPDLLFVIEFPWQELKGAPYSVLPVAIAALATGIALSLLQLCISFVFDQLVAFGVTSAILAISAFGVDCVGFACFSMAARCGAIVSEGYGLLEGLVICGAVCIMSILIGGLAFSGRFILGKARAL